MACDFSPQPSISQEQILDAVAAVGDAAALAPDLDSFLQQGVDTLRSLLGTDRVLIYRFLPNHDGMVVAESVVAPWRSLQGELIYDPCFAGGWGDRYRQGHIGMVSDVRTSTLEPCYASLLARFQVQAKLVVPVFVRAHLWALLIVHHCRSPRPWDQSSRSLVQHVTRQIAQGVYQRELESQLQRWQGENDPQGSDRVERLFQLLTDHVEQILFIRDAASGKFLYVSTAYDRIWGESRSALYADPSRWLSRIHPDDLPQVQQSVTQQFEGQPVQRQYRIVRPDGEVRWILAQVRSVAEGQNRPRYLVGWAEDYTDRRQIQANLRAAEATLSYRVQQEQLLRTLTARMRESLDLSTISAPRWRAFRPYFRPIGP